MTEDIFLELLGEILDRQVEELGNAVKLDSLGWDSLAILSMMSELEEKFSIELEAEKLSDTKTVLDLVKLVLEV